MICSLILLTSCIPSSVVARDTKLEDSIYSIMIDKDIEEININSLTDFNWEKAFIFPPYTTQESMNDQLGIDYIDSSNISSRDDINVIIFLNKGKVTRIAEIARRYGDLVTDTLTPTNDSIKIKRE